MRYWRHYNKLYPEVNREATKRRNRKRKQSNYYTSEAYRRWHSNYTEKIKRDVIFHYSPEGKCQNPSCEVPGGAKNFASLTIDHIHGGGKKQLRLLGLPGGYRFYLWLRKHHYPKGYQVLCMNCQFIKRQQNGELRHHCERKTSGLIHPQNQEIVVMRASSSRSG